MRVLVARLTKLLGAAVMGILDAAALRLNRCFDRSMTLPIATAVALDFGLSTANRSPGQYLFGFRPADLMIRIHRCNRLYHRLRVSKTDILAASHN